jgi:pSer/pThr/pTyr-binding forkhead associated (FHA) protein
MDKLTLVVISGQARGQRAQLTDRVRVGQAPDNDLVLPDESVAKYHCELERRSGKVVVRDLGTGDKTRVGDTAVQEATIEPGATLSVGSVALRLEPDPATALQFDPNRSYRETRASFEADFERRYVSWLLSRHNGNISAAAREAKMDRKHLYDLARKHGLRGERGGGSSTAASS